jgi:hypothetical protein
MKPQRIGDNVDWNDPRVDEAIRKTWAIIFKSFERQRREAIEGEAQQARAEAKAQRAS